MALVEESPVKTTIHRKYENPDLTTQKVTYRIRRRKSGSLNGSRQTSGARGVFNSPIGRTRSELHLNRTDQSDRMMYMNRTDIDASRPKMCLNRSQSCTGGSTQDVNSFGYFELSRLNSLTGSGQLTASDESTWSGSHIFRSLDVGWGSLDNSVMFRCRSEGFIGERQTLRSNSCTSKKVGSVHTRAAWLG